MVHQPSSVNFQRVENGTARNRGTFAATEDQMIQILGIKLFHFNQLGCTFDSVAVHKNITVETYHGLISFRLI